MSSIKYKKYFAKIKNFTESTEEIDNGHTEVRNIQNFRNFHNTSNFLKIFLDFWNSYNYPNYFGSYPITMHDENI